MTDEATKTLPAIVEKLIISPVPTEPEKVQIHLDGDETPYGELRIENKLTHENGEVVRLKLDAQVEVTVTAKSGATVDTSAGERA